MYLEEMYILTSTSNTRSKGSNGENGNLGEKHNFRKWGKTEKSQIENGRGHQQTTKRKNADYVDEIVPLKTTGVSPFPRIPASRSSMLQRFPLHDKCCGPNNFNESMSESICEQTSI
mmetsp:Transcript_9087/g.9860  ORF Transcript_9087/g.9860 Transcript_9087/m.9860 type:complete len:117 (-) Transcript_9087:802-1152(-)